MDHAALTLVSPNGWLLSRRGRSSPATASEFAPHRAPITGRAGPGFVAVKSYDTQWVACLLRRYVTPQGGFVSFQNGTIG
jgi:ketopantoate reductase